MFIAEKMGRSLEEILELSTLELKLWAGYYSLQKKERERAMKNGNRRNRR